MVKEIKFMATKVTKKTEEKLATSELLLPVVNEKSLLLAKLSKYTFKAKSQNLKLNKISVANEVSKIWKVKVLEVASVLTRGKQKRIGMTRNFRITPERKRFIVTIEKGKTIEGFSN